MPLILIVDDNERNLRLARDVLRAAGLGTLEAETGREALALAAERRPDVVLLDLRLPDIEGTKVARELRDGARTAGIPVVALTSLSLRGDEEWLVAAGFAGYLEKPISIGEFPAQVLAFCAPGGA